MKLFLLNLLTCALLCCAQVTTAATMYRCGNSFQDTPCVNHSYSKAMNSAAKQANDTEAKKDLSPYVVDAGCKQRGDAAKKIMWQRQVGKTKEEQLETAQDSQTHALISEVYNHRGTILEVRNSVEQTCMQQKEQDQLAEQLLLAAKKLKQRNGSSGAMPEQPATSKP
ncbi:hypothetical protein [Methylotenera sp.]|uniref:hypothetical protein n=1 Tax=Methylotenera sp. TaxID=2051956 RepID=UPI002EDBA0CB